MRHITLLLAAISFACIAPCLGADPAVDAARKALEADLAALRQAGEPASVEDLQPPAVPDAANGVLDLRAAYKAIDIGSAAYEQFDHMDLTGKLTPGQQFILRTVDTENADVCTLVEAGLAKGRFDWQIRMQSPMVKVVLPDLTQQRAVACTLQAAALAAHLEGDDDLALQRIQHILGIAKALDEQPFPISHSVACGITSLATQTNGLIASDLDAMPTTPTRKRAQTLIAELLDESATHNAVLRAFKTERVYSADTALAITDGLLKPDDLLAWLPKDDPNRPIIPRDLATARQIALEDARTAIQYSTQGLAAAEAPDWPTAKSRFPARPTFTPDRYFLRQMLPSFDRGLQSHFKCLATRRLATIALAVRCYTLDHGGKAPATLADLAPTYLPAVPTDPFTTDQPMRYLPDQGIIYSIGPDGKDDGGKELKPNSREPDIVLRPAK